VLRIAVPRRGRALPLLQLAYNRDDLPAGHSQNQLEEDALLAVVRALPPDVRPLVLADRGFGRATFLTWLQEQGPDCVVRITAGTGLVATDGSRWRLGTERLQPGELRWAPDMRYGQRYQGRPRDLRVNVALCWRLPRHMQRRRHSQQADESWYLATNQHSAQQAVAWYRQRFWIEESFKDSKSRLHLKHVRIGSPERLTRLLLALTIALCWLALAALPESSALPPRWHQAVTQWGRASFLSLALALLEEVRDLPLG
jgi:Transposase DDE domain